jgi:competence protein ComEC
MNLSIVAGLLVTIGVWLFGRRHYIYIWLALSVIWLYAIITGMQAPVIRAAIMASIFLTGELLGRQNNAFAALSLGAAIMAGFEPRILTDISFQMSFLAMIGLIFISPIIQETARKAAQFILHEENIIYRPFIAIADSLSVTLGAVLTVWPLIAYNFGLVSLIGPLATILLAPTLPIIIVIGIITAVTGVFSPLIAQGIGWILWIPLSYMIWLTNMLASLSIAAIQITDQKGSYWIWIYYSMLYLALCVKSKYRTVNMIKQEIIKKAISRMPGLINGFSKIPNKYYLIPLLALTFLTTQSVAAIPDNKLHVSFLDVGEGDAILIQIKNQNILIDGGPSPQKICLEISEKLPFWNRHFDLVILTHPHLDHLNGLVEVLRRYKVDQVLMPSILNTSPTIKELTDLIAEKKIKSQTAIAGQQILLNEDAILEVLSIPNLTQTEKEGYPGDTGIVLCLRFEKNSFLFTADIDKDTELELINQRLDITCNILKVAHHGSSNATSSEFIAVSNPQIAIISTGADNSFGHPSQEVLKRLDKQIVYRTDTSGTIEFITDGERIWVKTEKIEN